MSGMTNEARQDILRQLADLAEKKRRVLEESQGKPKAASPESVQPQYTQAPISATESNDSSGLASYLAKQNLFEETMNKKDKEEEEEEQVREIVRERILDTVITDKNLDIIKKLNF